MSRFKKLVNIIYYLMIIVIVVPFLLSINNISWFVETKLQQYLLDDRVRLGFTIVGAIVLIVLSIKIIVTIFKKIDERYLVLFEEGGKVSISDTVIEKTVINTLKEFEEVIEYTVKVKIKNKDKENSKVKVSVKCGLDEAVCKAKGYHDVDKKSMVSAKKNKKEKLEDKVKSDEKALENNEIKNSKTETSIKESIDMENLDVKKISISSNEKDQSVQKNEKSGSNEDITKEKLDLAVDIEASKLDKKESEELPTEIKDAKSVILSEDNSSEELKTSSMDSNVLNNNTHENSIKSQKKIVNMGIDDLCNTIQVRIHNSLEDFLAQKVDKVNIKFYDVEVKEKKIDSNNMNHKNKVDDNKISKKNKRVN
ncbi:MAG: alkaline shock response membrane anchor protein AmaP [Peptostreptococcus sp.]|uniref:alkaline shock response membrane anchor protein AmaP n=1 Tax=Peptostreptococcus sp. TaxID=1262 RepID=UPI002FC61C9F